MIDSHTYAEDTLAATSVLGLIFLLLGAGAPVEAQDRAPTSPSARSTPSQHSAGSAVQRRGPDRSTPVAPGTELPPNTRPSDPPSSFGQPPSSPNPAGGRTQANDGPNMPNNPPQAPLGGAEWLAAAGAAYALNRLRKRESADESEEE